jgi:hypothetical protein
MLSLISFCDRQSILENLLRDRNSERKAELRQVYIHDSNEGENGDDNSGSDSECTEKKFDSSEINGFKNDILTLRDYSFIIANKNKRNFKMRKLV